MGAGSGVQCRRPSVTLVQSSKDRHKLAPPWEGPFIVTEVLRLGTYKLQTADGEVFANTWNIE
jgi:hypothetical protein